MSLKLLWPSLRWAPMAISIQHTAFRIQESGLLIQVRASFKAFNHIPDFGFTSTFFSWKPMAKTKTIIFVSKSNLSLVWTSAVMKITAKIVEQTNGPDNEGRKLIGQQQQETFEHFKTVREKSWMIVACKFYSPIAKQVTIFPSHFSTFIQNSQELSQEGQPSLVSHWLQLAVGREERLTLALFRCVSRREKERAIVNLLWVVSPVVFYTVVDVANVQSWFLLLLNFLSILLSLVQCVGYNNIPSSWPIICCSCFLSNYRSSVRKRTTGYFGWF